MSTAVRLQIEGLHELMTALRQLPDDLTAEASGIIRAAAEGTAADVRARYPRGKTGNLVRGVTVQYNAPARGIVSAIVISSMYYAHFLEFGTKGRKSKKGLVGPVAARHYMLPIYYAARDQMHADLVSLVSAAGFEISNV